MKIVVNTGTEEILAAIEANDGYCPCKPDKTQDNKCMCREFLEQQTIGDCHCGLFKKVEVQANDDDCEG